MKVLYTCHYTRFNLLSRANNILLYSLLLMVFTSCKKNLEVSPVMQIDKKTVYANDATAIAAVTGIYNRMINGQGFASGTTSMGVLTGLSADEWKNYATANAMLSQAYINAMSSNNSPFWSDLYQFVYSANTVIEGVNNSQGLSAPVKRQLLGEAKFMRAFFYFYLVNLFGDVPLLTATDYQVNKVASRTSSADVYKQIVTDLQEAEELLNETYVGANVITANEERVRPNKWVAAALMARVYLFTGKYAEAEAQATAVINNTSLYALLDDLDAVFKKNSLEAIWQLQSIVPGYNTFDGNIFIINTVPNNEQPVALSERLLNDFEAGDSRAAKWINSITDNGTAFYFPYKYKIGPYNLDEEVKEYLMVFRLSEQYLIRAEARAQQSNIMGARQDLDKIRMRAGLPGATANDKNALLTAILHERRVELFTEWGHRWLDLKRTGKINEVMSVVAPLKGGSWNANWQWYPLPQSEIQLDKNLHQNDGY